MAIYDGKTGDKLLDSNLSAIVSAQNGKEARSPMASAIERCYDVAVVKAGGAQNNVTKAKVVVHSNRVRNAIYGEEVRDALKMGLQLVFSARGKSPSATATSIFNSLIAAQTGEDLKNNILKSIVRCYQEVK